MQRRSQLKRLRIRHCKCRIDSCSAFRFDLLFVRIEVIRTGTGFEFLCNPFLRGLEVNHPANAINVIVAGHARCRDRLSVDGAVVDLAIDVIELHSGMGVPVPIQTKGKRLTDTTKNVLVVIVRF